MSKHQAIGRLLRGVLAGGQARVLMCDTTAMAQAAMEDHHASRVCTAALGRGISAAALLTAAAEEETNSLTLTLSGGGPAGKLVVAAHGRRLKAYVDNPQATLPTRDDGKLDVGGALGRSGTVTVVRDLGLREPYVGQCPLQSGEVGEDVAYYCALSEQQPTLCSLGVLVADRVVASGGLLVQPLPGCDEAVLSALELRAPIYADISHHLQAERIDALFPQFFRGLDPLVLDDESLVYACDCSRERMERVLLSMGRAELEDILRTQGSAEVTCSFCRTAHRFGREELEALLLQA